MSYSFTVEVKEGKPSVDENAQAYGVPDGKFIVSGHVPAADGSDWQYETLMVSRLDDSGNQASQASATFRK